MAVAVRGSSGETGGSFCLDLTGLSTDSLRHCPHVPIPHGPVSPLQAQAQLQESSQKLDLLRLALEQLLEALPPAHPLRGRVARELRTAVSGNPPPSGALVKPTSMTGSQESLPPQSSPSLQKGL